MLPKNQDIPLTIDEICSLVNSNRTIYKSYLYTCIKSLPQSKAQEVDNWSDDWDTMCKQVDEANERARLLRRKLGTVA